jgi:hypothetical protein
VAYGDCNAQQFARERLKNVGCADRLGARQLDQQNPATGAFNQRAHGTGVTFSFTEVTFQVTEKLPVIHFRRANVGAEHVRDLSPAVLLFATKHTLVVGMTQAGNQLSLQSTYGLGISAVVADGAGCALEQDGNVAQAVVLMEQAGHGHAIFGLKLLVAAGCLLHLLTLQSLQVLHFTFESAKN